MDPVVIEMLVLALVIFLVSLIAVLAKYRSSLQFLLFGIGLILVGIALTEWRLSSLIIIFIGFICLVTGFIKKEKI